MIVFALALPSCSVGPDYESPKVTLPSNWQKALSQRPLASEAQLLNYWHQLDDSDLNILIKKMSSENLSVQEAFLRVQEATALYHIQRGEFSPDLDLSATLQHRRRSEAVASVLTSPRSDFLSFGGLMSWEIDVLGRLRRLNESSIASLEAAKEDFHNILVTLKAELASSYVTYRTIENQIRLTEENIRSQKESLGFAIDRYNAGLAPKLDVRQAESNLGTTEAALPLLRISLAAELNRLAVLIGGYREDVLAIISEKRPIPAPSKLNVKTLPLSILRQRPDVRQSERLLAAQHARIGAAEAELYSIVSLPGEISFQALDMLSDVTKSSSLAFSIGPSIRWNILDFGRVRGRIAVEDLRTKQLAKRYRLNVLEAVRETEDALVALEQHRLRAASLQHSVKASKESTELVKTLYVSGLTDFQNVLDSERRLFEQEISLAQSIGDSARSFVALFRALGGGWPMAEAEQP